MATIFSPTTTAVDTFIFDRGDDKDFMEQGSSCDEDEFGELESIHVQFSCECECDDGETKKLIEQQSKTKVGIFCRRLGFKEMELLSKVRVFKILGFRIIESLDLTVF
jgi:hypothetical protein